MTWDFRVIWWRKFLQRTFLEGLSALNRKRWDKQRGGGLTWMCQLRFSRSTPWVQFSFKVNGVLTEGCVCVCVYSWSWLLPTKSLRYQRGNGRESPRHGPCRKTQSEDRSAQRLILTERECFWSGYVNTALCRLVRRKCYWQNWCSGSCRRAVQRWQGAFVMELTGDWSWRMGQGLDTKDSFEEA